jgi:hypothetical protein
MSVVKTGYYKVHIEHKKTKKYIKIKYYLI